MATSICPSAIKQRKAICHHVVNFSVAVQSQLTLVLHMSLREHIIIHMRAKN